MTTIVLVIQFVLAIVLTVAVLLQKSSSIGLGAYSGSNESLFGAKGPAGFLAKFTFVVGLAFIINTLALGYLYNQSKKTSLAEKIKVEKPLKKYPTIPAVPTNSSGKTDDAPKAPTTK
ncbi:MAG: preprotein translocase subunit SecG [Epsilonproteobacteria bacterium]|nr:preprotein translocase subunit SecG [Campylobacterota bacterium]